METPAADFVGLVKNVLFSPIGSTRSIPQKSITLQANFGVMGDSHAGATRLLDVREKLLQALGYWKDTPMANLRKFSAISEEEVVQIIHKLKLGNISPGEFTENLIVKGIPGFTQLPEHTLLTFASDVGVRRPTVLEIKGENQPCTVIGENLMGSERNPQMDLRTHFPKAAAGLRGVVGIVLIGGKIKEGDQVSVFLPK